MTGQELFAALSFVDERFIQEAETASLHRNTPWMKVLSVAACLCILLVGAFAIGEFGHKGAMEEAAAPAAPAETEAAARWEEEMSMEEAVPEIADITTDELQHIPHACLRVTKVLEDGSFEAIVEADEPMEMDTQVTVVVDPSKVPGADKDAYGGAFLAVEEGDLLEISNGAFNADQNILYVSHVLIACE